MKRKFSDDDSDSEDPEYKAKYSQDCEEKGILKRSPRLMSIAGTFSIPSLHRISRESSLKKIKTEVEIIQKNIRDKEPNLFDILSAQLLSEDKEELYELHKIYHNLPENTLEKYNLKLEINRKISEGKNKYNYFSKLESSKQTELKQRLKNLEEHENKDELEYKIAELQTSSSNMNLIYSAYKRFQNMQHTNEEYIKLKYWLHWAVQLPYNKIMRFSMDSVSELLLKVKTYLDKNLYGMQKTKEQILLYINRKILNPSSKQNSLGLIGPPGCGKTTVARLLSNALDFPFAQISLGGINNPEFLKGHQYTYIGAEPGEIVKSLAELKVKNGIIFFDEYDRISTNKEIVSALLHITDNAQNASFEDSFLSGIKIDLSQIWFIYSMNNKPTDRALSDRIFYVEVPDYSVTEKQNILLFIWAGLCENTGFSEKQKLNIEKRAIGYIVSSFPTEGIRGLTYKLNELLGKLNFHLHNFKKIEYSFDLKKKITFPYTVSVSDVKKLLEI